MDIQVSIANVSRALRFMECLLKMLRLRGHNVEVNSQGAYAIVDGEKIKMIYREKCKRVVSTKYSWNSHEFHANGLLSFKTDGFHGGEWVDGNKQIEEYIPAIIAKMEISVKDLHRMQKEHREHMAELDAERRKVQTLQEQKDKELADFKSLLSEANRWNNVQLLRNYLEASEQKAKQTNTQTTEFEQWLNWAKEKTDWYDPFVNSPDELLADIDKVSLLPKKP
ncbi:MAG: hypothetical protein PHD73_04210 [Sediminibacterium sp.]|nr:hypothetical protein [Sediminibacterium sp.]